MQRRDTWCLPDPFMAVDTELMVSRSITMLSSTLHAAIGMQQRLHVVMVGTRFG